MAGHSTVRLASCERRLLGDAKRNCCPLLAILRLELDVRKLTVNEVQATTLAQLDYGNPEQFGGCTDIFMLRWYAKRYFR
jgi:hypothetical protein